MEEDKQLEKCVVGYFTSLLKIGEKWKGLVDSVEKPLNSLKNQTEQLRLISDDSLDKADICSEIDLRGKLVFKINVVIEDEIAIISNVTSQLNNLNQELINKLTRLESARSKVDLDARQVREFVIGTPHRPRLNLLMEWSIESSKYYDELYTSINSSLRNLNCKDEETVLNLIKSFDQEKTKRAEIEREVDPIKRRTSEPETETECDIE